MMLHIDPHSPGLRAFVLGLRKGFSAPASLFRPAARSAPPTAPLVPFCALPEGEAIANDWRRIGADFSYVMERYATDHARGPHDTGHPTTEPVPD